jgi:hypothetical protein
MSYPLRNYVEVQQFHILLSIELHAITEAIEIPPTMGR